MPYDPTDPDLAPLAIDKKQLKNKNASFDGKKACWIPDQKEGFI